MRHRTGLPRWKNRLEETYQLSPVPHHHKKSSDGETDYVNYEPREDHCKAACTLGKKLKVPVYEFLKEPLVRKYGEEFYEALDATAHHLGKKKIEQVD